MCVVLWIVVWRRPLDTYQKHDIYTNYTYNCNTYTYVWEMARHIASNNTADSIITNICFEFLLSREIVVVLQLTIRSHSHLMVPRTCVVLLPLYTYICVYVTRLIHNSNRRNFVLDLICICSYWICFVQSMFVCFYHLIIFIAPSFSVWSTKIIEQKWNKRQLKITG